MHELWHQSSEGILMKRLTWYGELMEGTAAIVCSRCSLDEALEERGLCKILLI